MKNDGPIVAIVAFLMFCLTLLSFIVGIKQGESITQRQAIAQGHAEWSADKDGWLMFKWKNHQHE